MFERAVRARAALYARRLLPVRRLDGPTISVGNLSVGGSGKTPVVALIARTLRSADVPVAILSRGYGGRFRGPCLVVSDGRNVLADARDAGDEPVMLARGLPGVVVAVGRQRDLVGSAVQSRFGPCVNVLDDAFQHMRVARDLDILCVSEGDLGDQLLPVGRLREPISAASRAGIVLIEQGEDQDASARLRALAGPERTFHLQRHAREFVDADGRAAPAPHRAFLLCGIARPERFVTDTRALCTVVDLALFRDHHRFTVAELETIVARARAAAADAIVTTEKDLVRFPSTTLDLPVRALRLSVDVEPADAFRERLLAVARRLR